jgi:hypothetical protein
VGEWRYSFTILDIGTRVGCEWSATSPGRFTREKISPSIHWIGTGCVWRLWRREETCHSGNRALATQPLTYRCAELSRLLTNMIISCECNSEAELWCDLLKLILLLLNSHSGEWSPNWVHLERRPLLAYCTCPGWLWGLKNLVEWRLAGETEVLGENQRQIPRDQTRARRAVFRPGWLEHVSTLPVKALSAFRQQNVDCSGRMVPLYVIYRVAAILVFWCSVSGINIMICLLVSIFSYSEVLTFNLMNLLSGLRGVHDFPIPFIIGGLDYCWNDNFEGKSRVVREDSAPVPFCSPKNLYVFSWILTHDVASRYYMYCHMFVTRHEVWLVIGFTEPL